MADRRLLKLIKEHGLARLQDSILAVCGEGFRLKLTPVRKGARLKLGVTKFGGMPHVPRGFRWPKRGARALTFVAQFDMASIKSGPRWPDSGLLLFFYDVKKQPWGFAPKDRGSWAVVHVPKGTGKLKPMAMPGDKGGAAYEGGSFPECSVKVSSAVTIPPYDNVVLTGILTNDDDRMAYFDLYDAFWAGVKGPQHQLFGWPKVEQSDMEGECQLAFHGIDCGGEDDELCSPRARAFTDGAARWQLLLQVDSDDDLGVMWGDMGKIYFFATAESRATLRFDETWTVLQCG